MSETGTSSVLQLLDQLDHFFAVWVVAGEGRIESRAHHRGQRGALLGGCDMHRAALFAQLIRREVGKVIWDARGEAKLVPAKVGVSLDDGMRLVKEVAIST